MTILCPRHVAVIMDGNSRWAKKNNVPKEEGYKEGIKKLQGLYEDPDSIPDEIKLQVSKKVSEKRKEIRNIYMSPGEVFTLERVGRWGIVQVVKLFLGMPVVPGR